MRDVIPKTDSIEELARFWDTHDLTDFEDQLEEVTVEVFEREAEPVIVPLQPRHAREIAASNWAVGGDVYLGGGMPTSDAALAAWDRWVAALAARYRDRVKVWEVWNESDLNEDNPAETYDMPHATSPSSSTSGFTSASCGPFPFT